MQGMMQGCATTTPMGGVITAEDALKEAQALRALLEGLDRLMASRKILGSADSASEDLAIQAVKSAIELSGRLVRTVNAATLTGRNGGSGAGI